MIVSCRDRRSTRRSRVQAPRLYAGASVLRMPTLRDARRTVSGAFEYRYQLAHKLTCATAIRRRLCARNNRSRSAVWRSVSSLVSAPLLTPYYPFVLRPLRACWYRYPLAQPAGRSRPLRRRFWERLNRRRKRLSVRLRDVVKVAVLSLRNHVDLLDVRPRESAATEEQSKRQRDGIEEAPQLGEDQDRWRADGRRLAGGD